jgi:pyruvate formate lyase activating enzyme
MEAENIKILPKIMGFNKTSEAGFNVFASSIFLFGCNMRCPYCMNGRIVIQKESDWASPVKEVDLNIVKSHVIENKVDWVMISGGEPTLTPLLKLKNLINEIKSWGCRVGISTNGTNPDIILKIIDDIDHVALDLKSSKVEVYEELEFRIGKKKDCFNNFLKTKSILCSQVKKRTNFSYEIRTTLYPEYFNLTSVDEIGGIIRENETWVFQQYRHAKNMLDEDRAKKQDPYSEEILGEIVESAKKYCNNVKVRYV